MAFADAIVALVDDAERRAALGAAAHSSYAESHLAQDAIMARFMREALVGGAPRRNERARVRAAIVPFGGW